MDRFFVASVEDAVKRGWITREEFRYSDDYDYILFDLSFTPPKVLHIDGGEPEDNRIYRDWAWVPVLLNELNNQIEELKRKQ
jgi:hypothetical protein